MFSTHGRSFHFGFNLCLMRLFALLEPKKGEYRYLAEMCVQLVHSDMSPCHAFRHGVGTKKKSILSWAFLRTSAGYVKCDCTLHHEDVFESYGIVCYLMKLQLQQEIVYQYIRMC